MANQHKDKVSTDSKINKYIDALEKPLVIISDIGMILYLLSGLWILVYLYYGLLTKFDEPLLQ